MARPLFQLHKPAEEPCASAQSRQEFHANTLGCQGQENCRSLWAHGAALHQGNPSYRLHHGALRNRLVEVEGIGVHQRA
jgi:hypothetical protein